MKEHHGSEVKRMQSNVEFWKEKCDTLMKEKKEMLETKTKLHR